MDDDEIRKDGKRILIVDDDTLNVMGLKEVIRSINPHYFVATASSGKAAIEIAEKGLKNGKPITQVFMDLQMHEMDGFETTQKLRTLYEGHRQP